MHLLITRPFDQAKRTAARLEELGHQCSVEPLLDIEDIGSDFPDQTFDAIIVTSSNAVSALNRHWPSTDRETVPLFVTGEATKIAVQAAGFSNCRAVNGSATELFEQIPVWTPKNTKIIYPCAKTIAHDPTPALLRQNISCTIWPVYEAKPAVQFSSATKHKLLEGEIDGILLYSPRTAKTFVTLWQQEKISVSPPKFYALSHAVCAELPQQMADICSFPTQPTENDLFKLISK